MDTGWAQTKRIKILKLWFCGTRTCLAKGLVLRWMDCYCRIRIRQGYGQYQCDVWSYNFNDKYTICITFNVIIFVLSGLVTKDFFFTTLFTGYLCIINSNKLSKLHNHLFYVTTPRRSKREWEGFWRKKIFREIYP